jgi:Phage integrase family
VFDGCLTNEGLGKIRFHELRRSFASWVIANGESLAYVKDQMGHHSIQITVDACGHLVPGSNRETVNRLAEILAKRAADAPELLVAKMTSFPTGRLAPPAVSPPFLPGWRGMPGI